MSITIKKIFQCLVDNLHEEKLQQENMEIYNSKLLLENQNHFDSNTLYMGKLSALNKDEIPHIPCFIGINDSNIPSKQLYQYFINCAFLKDDCDLFKSFNKVQDTIYRERRFIHSSSALLQSMIKGRGLQYIIDIGCKILNNPILLVDSSYKLLAHSKNDDVDDVVWNELISKGHCSYDMVSTFMKEGVVKKIADNNEPVLTDSGFSKKTRRIHGKIIINNKLVGYLGILEYNQKFKEEDYRIINLLCDVISSKMQKKRHIKGFMHENLLIDLLDNNIKNNEQLQERLKITELKLENNLYLAVIDFKNKDISNNHIIDYLRDHIDQLVQHSWPILYKNQIVTFISLKDDQFEKTITNIEKYLANNNLQAGISASFNDIFYSRKAYQQAKKALELGNNIHNSRKLFHYPDYRIYHLISLAGENHSLIDLQHPAPLKLKDYDEKEKTNLYQTLYIFLKNNKNTLESAEELFIHRNTMYHRLKKITKITEIDLKNQEQCFQAYLSYKILEIFPFSPVPDFFPS